MNSQKLDLQNLQERQFKMKLQWENNKTASLVIKVAVILLLLLGIYQFFLTK